MILEKVYLAKSMAASIISSINMERIILLSAFLLFCLMAVKLVKKSKSKNNSKVKLPPGPNPLPIIGNIHQLYGGQIHHILRDLANKYGPLMHLQFGEVPTIIISSPEVAKEVLKTHDILFAERPSNIVAFKVISYNFTDIIFSPYGNYWRQLRKICTMELLSPKRVQSFRSIREDEVLNLMESISLCNGSLVNLSRKIFSLTYSITARAAFGKRNKYEEKYVHLTEEINRLAAGFSIADLYPSVHFLQVLSGMRRKLETAHKQLDEILQDILNEHKEEVMKSTHRSGEAKEDLVDVLLNIQQRGHFEIPLTDNNFKAVMFNIFSAGSETSSTTVEWTMSELMKNPAVMKRAQDEVRKVFDDRGNVDESGLDELKYLEAIIKESMRLHPGAPLLVPRVSRQQCEINGYDIPAKTRVFVNAWAIGRDPKVWTEPEVFNPDRFLDSEIDYKGNDFEFIPFGAGRRMCPGISFATPNIMLPLAQFLFHFDWQLPGGLKEEQLDMTESMGVTVRRKTDLNLVPILYHRSSLK